MLLDPSRTGFELIKCSYLC